MPIYEYRCSACGFEKEALQRMSDAPLIECPKCGQSALVKLVSAAGFQLKGSGWYATDFKNSGAVKPDKGAKAKTDTPGTNSDTASGGTAAAASDAKPAEKSGTSTSTTDSGSSTGSSPATAATKVTPSTPTGG